MFFRSSALIWPWNSYIFSSVKLSETKYLNERRFSSVSNLRGGNACSGSLFLPVSNIDMGYTCCSVARNIQNERTRCDVLISLTCSSVSKTTIKQTMFCSSAPVIPSRLARKSLVTYNLKYPKSNEWWPMSCFVCLRSFAPNRICKDSWLCSSILRLSHAPGHRNSLSSATPKGHQK